VNSVVRNCFCCKAVRTVNQHFSELKIEQAPDKTFIGVLKKDSIFWVIDLVCQT
jgi:hypothetical protein